MDNLEAKFSSIKQLVEFKNIHLEYLNNECLKCTYVLLNYKSQEGDRIAIYKLGWTTVKEYTVFEWVPVNDANENYVIFSQSVLPKNSTDMFQFCYISSENQTYGVSEPFQFVNANMKLSSLDSIKSISDSDYSSLNCEQELLKLKEENKVFREKLQIFMNMLVNTQTLLCQQQKEINILKEKCEQLEEKNMSLNFKDSMCNNPLHTLSTSIHIDFDMDELETLPPFPFAK